MGYNVDVLRRRRDQLNAWGVRIRWAGRRPRLWGSVIRELESAEQMTARNKTLTLTMCVNYGSRIEIVDAINEIAAKAASGAIKPGAITERNLTKYLNSSYLPDVDLFIRSSGEQRISNFLLWQSAYAELVFDETPWPDFSRETLWKAISDFTNRDRRFGAAVDKPAKPSRGK
jgi:undecaprenyl diphosphate synthase